MGWGRLTFESTTIQRELADPVVPAVTHQDMSTVGGDAQTVRVVHLAVQGALVVPTAGDLGQHTQGYNHSGCARVSAVVVDTS